MGYGMYHLERQRKGEGEVEVEAKRREDEGKGEDGMNDSNSRRITQGNL